jgi:hypothetical protein
MKIQFFDDCNSHPERNTFRQDLLKKLIKTSIGNTGLSDFQILFIHGGDSHYLNDINLGDVYKIYFGDNTTDSNLNDFMNKEIGYINFQELSSKIDVILTKLNVTAFSLTSKSLFEIIFSKSPQFLALEKFHTDLDISFVGDDTGIKKIEAQIKKAGLNKLN